MNQKKILEVKFVCPDGHDLEISSIFEEISKYGDIRSQKISPYLKIPGSVMAIIDVQASGDSKHLLHAITSIFGGAGWVHEIDQWDCEAIWPNSQIKDKKLRGFIQWIQIQVLQSVLE